MGLSVRELAEKIGAELVGGGEQVNRRIDSVGPIGTACVSDVTFVADEKHTAGLADCEAGAVIVGARIEGLDTPQLVVEDVDRALIEVLGLFAPRLAPPTGGIDPTAAIGPDVSIGEGVSIGPGVVVAGGVEIGQDSVICGGCKIGENSKLGRNCRLDSNVVIYHNCLLGDNVVVQANTTIGSTGFGYSFIDGRHRLIPHNGGVVVEEFVEIGANCCIDRAKFGNTIIGAGTKIDNLVQIAHNVVIGKCCLIAAQVGIAGSCKLGDGIVLAGQVGLADNIEIGAGTMIGAQAGVMRSVGPGEKLAWSPAIDVKEAVRVVAQLLRLPKLAQQVKRLAKKVEKLEAAEDDRE